MIDWPVSTEDPTADLWDAAVTDTAEREHWRVEQEGTDAWLTNGASRIPWFTPNEGKQEEAVFSPARWKLWRFGRRFGKTRGMWLVSVEGHGPDVQRNGLWEPLHRGIMHGFDVCWLARDNPQADAIWEEEIKPFFKDVDGVTVVESRRRYVKFHGTPGRRGFGCLHLRSNENVNSIKGIGKYLIGVAIDEAAFFDLEYALDRVIGPALIDNHGWCVISSTTNGGRDGSKARPDGPSWFNTLCEMVIRSRAARESGRMEDVELPDDWEEFHGSTRENKGLSEVSIEAEYARLKHRPAAIAEELDALLGIKPSGVAFPEWRSDLILTAKDWVPPAYWPCEAGFDWGFSSPGWFGINHFGPERRVHASHELLFNGYGAGGWNRPNATPFEIGQHCGRLILASGHAVSRIVADIPDTHKDGRGGVALESVQEEFERGVRSVMGNATPPILRQKKGDKSRAARKLKVHELLRYEEIAGIVQPWNLPRLSINPRCVALVACLSSIPLDPANKDDVDTDSTWDHAYDGASGLWLAKRTHAETPRKPVDQDTYVIQRPKPVQRETTYVWGKD